MKGWRAIGAAALMAAGSGAKVTAGAEPATLRGVPEVVDGDTLLLEGQRIRLAGIDAPPLHLSCHLNERAYACGEIARAAALDLVAGLEVVCEVLGEGADGALLGRCEAGGFEINRNMLHTGWAMPEADADPAYQAVADAARAERRGLWRGTFEPPPWE